MNDLQLMAIFESEYQEYNLERHHKEFFAVCMFYKNKQVNDLFVAFRQGYLLNAEGE